MLLRNMSCVAIRNWFPVTILAVIAFFIITRFSNSLPRGVYRVCMCSAECNWTIYVLCICEYYTVGPRLYITRHIIMSMSCMFTLWYVCSMYVCLYVILSFQIQVLYTDTWLQWAGTGSHTDVFICFDCLSYLAWTWELHQGDCVLHTLTEG